MTQDLETAMKQHLDGKFFTYIGNDNYFSTGQVSPLATHYSKIRRDAVRAEKKAARMAINNSMAAVPPATMFDAILTLEHAHGVPHAHPRLATILAATAEVTGIPISELRGIGRQNNICTARQIYYWIARHYTPCSFPQIGGLVGKDHTTIIHGIRKITKGLYTYQDTIDAINGLVGITDEGLPL